MMNKLDIKIRLKYQQNIYRYIELSEALKTVNFI